MKDAKSEEPVKAGYVPPSRRVEDKSQKPLTAEQLDSQTNFPSLSMGSPMTKAASWGQLRSRLLPEAQESMKAAIEESLKRNEAALEEAQSREAITDPFLMTREKAQREGWEVLRLKPEDRRAWFNKSTYNLNRSVEEPYAWPNSVMSFSVDKVQKLVQSSYTELPF
jgi:hypothetical protein